MNDTSAGDASLYPTDYGDVNLTCRSFFRPLCSRYLAIHEFIQCIREIMRVDRSSWSAECRYIISSK
ncbi:uncharacterized protein BO96DRAFT_224060 [Aspergillus niger CBS 101883]|uniref:Uncharacterized protein n=2 Tax=Aspergillus niger TaxID=5061 RepID=A2R3L9_ASPNC|nr:uncharacterized protein BO96DRAFT_224060 [Aspergillus niger CBS 101883]XP_059602320.1 hypothetical protein An14g04765 [Aspergillus niger]PYH50497.1 hypothetical protein BO96DRAFT_224060 [Aspergillus niger CBS 101883]CAK42037.1 hypothetical protein An14g04765 [Aspergillus niger]